jgi:hypothetical protein
MMIETALGSPESYPALGFDPAPGAPERVSSLAADLTSVATELDTAAQVLTRMGSNGGIWQGEAAQAFHQKLGELPDYLGKAYHSFGEAAATLQQWSLDLTSLRTSAARYETEAEQARQRVQAAESNPDLKLVDQTFCEDDGSLTRAQARYDAATAELDAAVNELEAIRCLARRLLTQHEELASKVADALRRAKDEAPEEPGLVDEVCTFINDVKHTASAAWRWVQHHAHVIAQFGDLMSTISTVLGVLAIITIPFGPVSAALAGTAAITSLAALGTHGLAKAAGADVGVDSMALDAIGTLPFIGGIGRGAKISTEAERALNATRSEVLGYASTREAQLGGTVTLIGRYAKGDPLLVGQGVVGRLSAGIESAYQNVREGEWIGTKGLNPIIKGLGGTGIDPLSVGGRVLNASLKLGGDVAGEVYHHIAGAGEPPSASATLSSRVAARSAA